MQPKLDMGPFGASRRRDHLLGIKKNWYQAKQSIEYVGPLTLSCVQSLINEGFLSVDDYQNYGPTAGEVVNLMKEYPNEIYAYGYAVSPFRADCRVTIDSICIVGDLYERLKTEDWDNTDYGPALNSMLASASENFEYHGTWRLWWD